MDKFAEQLNILAEWFGYVLVPTVLAVALFFTVRLRFVQFVRFREAIRETIASRQTGTSGALTPLQAFMTAIAATVGTGNIVGVATAIVAGGPGALFWIWVYGLLAMSTKFAEASLGVHFRIARGEEVLSGPMYYLRDGLKSPFLAGLFAVLGGCGVLFTTPLSQPNSVAKALAGELSANNITFGSIPIGSTKVDGMQLVIGIVLAVLTWLVIVHGIKSIGRAAEKLSPIKVGFYFIGGLVVIITHLDRVPEVFATIFREAFSTEPVAGSALGLVMMKAMNVGIRRGVYANEAGYGTAAVAYGTAKSHRPDQQGLAAMMDVFIVTFVTCTLSALSLLLTDAWKSGKDGAEAVALAFNASIPGFGGWMIAISITLFAYTVLIGWAFYGEQFLEYLFGPRIIKPFRWMYCLLIPFGAVIAVKPVWAWGDICNGLQVFPNVIGLIGLSGLAAAYARTRHDPARPARDS
jgi:alanine or glycine:cation symporter, AGCS family